ncbi:hypothetical protein BKE56_028435 [Rhodococcus sp. M8]|nr:hypothetical protein BKE56_028435 [Rhodococcus sp. M8]
MHRATSAIASKSVSVLIQRSRHLSDTQFDSHIGTTPLEQLESSELHHSVPRQVIDDLPNCQYLDQRNAMSCRESLCRTGPERRMNHFVGP